MRTPQNQAKKAKKMENSSQERKSTSKVVSESCRKKEKKDRQEVEDGSGEKRPHIGGVTRRTRREISIGGKWFRQGERFVTREGWGRKLSKRENL